MQHTKHRTQQRNGQNQVFYNYDGNGLEARLETNNLEKKNYFCFGGICCWYAKGLFANAKRHHINEMDSDAIIVSILAVWMSTTEIHHFVKQQPIDEKFFLAVHLLLMYPKVIKMAAIKQNKV